MEPVVEWDHNRVIRWFNQNGFPGYDEMLRENSIDGEVLINLDHESLRDLGIRALGKRLLVLKSIYFLKLQHDVPITSDSHVPQTVDVEPDNVHSSSHQRRQRRQMEDGMARMMAEIGALSSEVAMIRSDMQRMYRLTVLENKPLPAPHRPAADPFSSTVVVTRRHPAEPESRRDGKARPPPPTGPPPPPTGPSGPPVLTGTASTATVPASGHFAPTLATPVSGAHSPGAAAAGSGVSSLLLPGTHAGGAQTPVTPHIRVYGDNALQRENESYKSFRISADDPCSTILPHALKKYHISDSWQNYTLCIQFGAGPAGKVERALAMDEKPLYLFQQLKDAGELPVFVLKKKGAADGHSTTARGGSSSVSGGSRASLFSLEHNNASSSSVETPMASSAAVLPVHELEKA
ncbi:hypothetical protein LPJ61_000623 [Coemansia biformis]|uniref:RA-domain-containing protein n=1 Tax=Coemansia biformis TaxID=1286918 RepID=A0A9W8CYV8_9FUNG|nr:hypothetical protein LPJ61_000623 [Coemansia biformis]